ncbi:hypothetical protein BZA77DRAFT_42679 [Pyronema omphalodes]|nr:hypothetical protein BZA77DRAFT_42679 [Pyronema omphalodes]
MAEVLAVPMQFDGYYRSSSPRCRSPQQSYTPPYESTIPRSHMDNKYESFGPVTFSPPPSSTASSPELSSVVFPAHSSSSVSSVSSSICLDDEPDLNDSFLPVYDFADALQRSPSPEPLSPEDDDETECPSPAEIDEENSTDGKQKAADDTFVRHEPSRHVDYLSHEWKEEDIWASWRYMVGKRNVHTNAARLENASWRTWAKKKHRLRTFSADKLNWMKDCDVTWLYGPLCIGTERLTARPPRSPSASPAEVKVQSYKTKPILKKRSMSEIMLQRSLSTSSLLKQATAVIESQQSSHIYPSPRPGLIGRANSDFAYPRSRMNSVVDTLDQSSTLSSTGCQSPSQKKHIHFNDRVQQCIAVETDDDDNYDDEDDFYGRIYDADDSSSDDGIMMAGPKSAKMQRKVSNELQTIAHLPSTTLKYKEEPVPKKKTSLLNSFFSAPKPAPAPAPAPKPTIAGTKTYVLEDDDDMCGLDWEPTGAFGKKDSPAIARAVSNSGAATPTESDGFQLPNFNSWDDEDPASNGIFGRAVDAVNTARDIAHVLWNVGWRR